MAGMTSVIGASALDDDVDGHARATRHRIGRAVTAPTRRSRSASACPRPRRSWPAAARTRPSGTSVSCGLRRMALSSALETPSSVIDSTRPRIEPCSSRRTLAGCTWTSSPGAMRLAMSLSKTAMTSKASGDDPADGGDDGAWRHHVALADADFLDAARRRAPSPASRGRPRPGVATASACSASMCSCFWRSSSAKVAALGVGQLLDLDGCAHGRWRCRASSGHGRRGPGRARGG